jgi:5,10-methylenetetrahydrofolate reductase
MYSDKLRKLTELDGEPLLCFEVNPPRGVSFDQIFLRLDGNLGGIDFLNVTDCALARMKLAALPFAGILKQKFNIEVLANVACRDKNLIAIQADLLAAWAMGVTSVVALTGDAVTIGDSPERKGVFEVNSIGLLHAIQSLNAGHDISGHELKGNPAFISGVVVNPNARNIGAELKRLERKKAAGATYALSQPVFDEKVALEFLQQAKSVGMPIMLGLLPLKSAASLETLTAIPGIKLPERLQSDLKASGQADISETSLEHCLELANACRPYVRGFHIVTGPTPSLALKLVKRMVKVLKG